MGPSVCAISSPLAFADNPSIVHDVVRTEFNARYSNVKVNKTLFLDRCRKLKPARANRDSLVRTPSVFSSRQAIRHLTPGSSKIDNSCYRIFGRPLRDLSMVIVDVPCGDAPSYAIMVPKIIVVLTDFLSRPTQVVIEGLFRKAGSAHRQRVLRQRFELTPPDEWPGLLESQDTKVSASPIDVAAILKQLLRELISVGGETSVSSATHTADDPLIPYKFQHLFLECCTQMIASNPQGTQDNDSHSCKLGQASTEAILLATCLMPVTHLASLVHLCRFATLVAAHADSNKMDFANLAIVLTPCLFTVDLPGKRDGKGNSFDGSRAINGHSGRPHGAYKLRDLKQKSAKFTSSVSSARDHLLDMPGNLATKASIVEALIRHADKIGILPIRLVDVYRRKYDVSTRLINQTPLDRVEGVRTSRTLASQDQSTPTRGRSRSECMLSSPSTAVDVTDLAESLTKQNVSKGPMARRQQARRLSRMRDIRDSQSGISSDSLDEGRRQQQQFFKMPNSAAILGSTRGRLRHQQLAEDGDGHRGRDRRSGSLSRVLTATVKNIQKAVLPKKNVVLDDTSGPNFASAKLPELDRPIARSSAISVSLGSIIDLSPCRSETPAESVMVATTPPSKLSKNQMGNKSQSIISLASSPMPCRQSQTADDLSNISFHESPLPEWRRHRSKSSLMSYSRKSVDSAKALKTTGGTESVTSLNFVKPVSLGIATTSLTRRISHRLSFARILNMASTESQESDNTSNNRAQIRAEPSQRDAVERAELDTCAPRNDVPSVQTVNLDHAEVTNCGPQQRNDRECSLTNLKRDMEQCLAKSAICQDGVPVSQAVVLTHENGEPSPRQTVNKKLSRVSTVGHISGPHLIQRRQSSVKELVQWIERGANPSEMAPESSRVAKRNPHSEETASPVSPPTLSSSFSPSKSVSSAFKAPVTTPLSTNSELIDGAWTDAADFFGDAPLIRVNGDTVFSPDRAAVDPLSFKSPPGVVAINEDDGDDETSVTAFLSPSRLYVSQQQELALNVANDDESGSKRQSIMRIRKENRGQVEVIKSILDSQQFKHQIHPKADALGLHTPISLVRDSRRAETSSSIYCHRGRRMKLAAAPDLSAQPGRPTTSVHRRLSARLGTSGVLGVSTTRSPAETVRSVPRSGIRTSYQTTMTVSTTPQKSLSRRPNASRHHSNVDEDVMSEGKENDSQYVGRHPRSASHQRQPLAAVDDRGQSTLTAPVRGGILRKRSSRRGGGSGGRVVKRSKSDQSSVGRGETPLRRGNCGNPNSGGSSNVRRSNSVQQQPSKAGLSRPSTSRVAAKTRR